jgi:hypothetical protein
MGPRHTALDTLGYLTGSHSKANIRVLRHHLSGVSGRPAVAMSAAGQ